MRLAYVGNFDPPHSTENDVNQTLLDMHVDVVPVQEQNVNGWRHLMADPGAYDAILWTSTKSLAEQIPRTMQLEMLYQARRSGIPTIGLHLDRWWGLQRWRSVLEAPFFRCQYVFTADGAHDDEFSAAGVNHHWSPPAIAPRNVMRGTPRREFRSDIAFVGSWQGGYHEEWQHRHQLVEFLRKTYGDRVQFWPKKGHHAVRGKDLVDLYASVKVVVGDSCLVPTTSGEPMHHYCSDRVFETLGRGGFLIHPWVEGIVGTKITDLLGEDDLGTWALGDWDGLREEIDSSLDDTTGYIERTATHGYESVAALHTYWNRLDAIFAWVGLEDYTKPSLVLP